MFLKEATAIVSEMLESVYVVEKLQEKLYYAVFVFAGNELIKVYKSNFAPNPYVGVHDYSKYEDIRFNHIEFTEEQEAADFIAEFILLKSPIENKRLPDGHRYYYKEKAKQYINFIDGEFEELYAKKGRYIFDGRPILHEHDFNEISEERFKKDFPMQIGGFPFEVGDLLFEVTRDTAQLDRFLKKAKMLTRKYSKHSWLPKCFAGASEYHHFTTQIDLLIAQKAKRVVSVEVDEVVLNEGGNDFGIKRKVFSRTAYIPVRVIRDLIGFIGECEKEEQFELHLFAKRYNDKGYNNWRSSLY